MREMSAGRAPRNIRTILLLLLPGRLMRFVGRAGERGGRGASPFSAIPLIRLIRIRPGRQAADADVQSAAKATRSQGNEAMCNVGHVRLLDAYLEVQFGPLACPGARARFSPRNGRSAPLSFRASDALWFYIQFVFCRRRKTTNHKFSLKMIV